MSDPRFKWRHDFLVADQTIVGSVFEAPSGEWFAYGAMDEWEDTELGTYGDSEAAKARVLDWAENHL